MEQNEKNEAYVIVVETGMPDECYLGQNDVVVSKVHGARMYHDELYAKSDLWRIIRDYKNTQCAWLNDEKNLSIKKVVILDGDKNYKILEPGEHYISIMYPDMVSMNTACQKIMFGVNHTDTKFLTEEEKRTLESLTAKWCKEYEKFRNDVVENIIEELKEK